MKFIIEMRIGDGWSRINDEVYDNILSADRALNREQRLHPSITYRIEPAPKKKNKGEMLDQNISN